ncbi:MAG: winged helix DNA-binding domain-containing protein [Chloroflexaceae bacterium]|nr:winged helix DNA-binding domain-containing protein [Chloroflexaceae bacterium]
METDNTAKQLTSQHIGPHRLRNQRITGQKCQTPAQVVTWMGALQAQDYHQALWAIGLRLQSPSVATVEQAIEAGHILRTWPMRGTIHFVPPADAKWMLKLSAARMLAADGRRLSQLDLTHATMVQCETLLSNALGGGQRLTREAIMNLLEDAGISTAGQRGYHILWYLAQSGSICLGPMSGKQQTFVLLDEWVPHPRNLPREEALAELAARFFTSHGPATLADFARWSGLTIADARLGLQMNGSTFIATTINGTAYWLSAEDQMPNTSESGGVSFLPGFDEYILGYKDRSDVIAAEHAHKIVPGNNGIFFPTIVIDGQIVATWKRKLKRKSIDITIDPFTPLGDWTEPVRAAANAYSDFLGLPIDSITIS